MLFVLMMNKTKIRFMYEGIARKQDFIDLAKGFFLSYTFFFIV